MIDGGNTNPKKVYLTPGDGGQTFVVELLDGGVVRLPAEANGSWMDPDYEE